MTLTTEEDSPGVLSRIEVVDPPYMAPKKMAQNMMIAARGSPSAKTTGSNNDMVTAGPRPGSTPTAVPIAAPRNAYSRYSGLRTVPNAENSWRSESISEDS